MTDVDLSAPITILAQETLNDRRLLVTAVTAYGRQISCVVEWWQTSAVDIERELRATWALQIKADQARQGALASWWADGGDIDALDDTDTGASVS